MKSTFAPSSHIHLLQMFLWTVTGLPKTQQTSVTQWLRTILHVPSQISNHQAKAIQQAQTQMRAFLLSLPQCLGSHQNAQNALTFSRLSTQYNHREITENEYLRAAFGLIRAGYETVSSFLSLVLLAVHQTDGLWNRLCHNPQDISLVIQEGLRFCNPVPVGQCRFARQRIEIGPHIINPGEPLLFHFHAANRDPCVFADPDAFDIDRHPAPKAPCFWSGHAPLPRRLPDLDGDRNIY